MGAVAEARRGMGAYERYFFFFVCFETTNRSFRGIYDTMPVLGR